MPSKAKRRSHRVVARQRAIRRFQVYAYFLGGPHRAYEKFLERVIVARPSDGTGFEFKSGLRDVSWSFAREASARRAFHALLDVPGIEKVHGYKLDPETFKAVRWKP